MESNPSSLSAAIVYDFDGTLARGNIQEHSLIPEHLQTSKEGFWRLVKDRARDGDADEILLYLQLMMEKAEEVGAPITQAILKDHGARAPLFAGVSDWFDRINAYAAKRNLALEHHIVSSGNQEMIEGTSIAGHFKYIFGSRFLYSADGHAHWPAVAINYTGKTQFLFRINKGVGKVSENDAVNRWIPPNERAIPFSRMVYLGDGDTDIPSMKMVRHQGGHSVAVFDPELWADRKIQSKVYNLIAEDRADFVVPADYTDGSQLDITIKGILGRIARDEAGYRGTDEATSTGDDRK